MRTVSARPRPVFRPLAVAALLGLTLSSLVHALSYVGIAVQDHIPTVWGLHVGIFAVFFPLVFALRRWQDGRRLRWREILPYFPRWVPVVAGVGMAYAMVSFVLASQHLSQRGEVTAGYAKTPEERLYEIRAFSGHWLIFYGAPALFFLYVPAGARPRGEEDSEREAAV